jgi:hypothetical protein
MAPSKVTPERDDVVTPLSTSLSPTDRLLAACPTREEIASVDADLRLSFEADPTTGEPLACRASDGSRDLSPLKKRVYNSLLLMRKTQFDQPLPWTKDPLYTWLTRAITGIRFRADIANSSCCSPSRVLNVAVSNLVLNYTDRWMDPIARGGIVQFILLLGHEARHSEGHTHTCGTKDQTLEELGAWGVQYYLSRWFAEHTDQSAFATDPVRPGQWLLKQAEFLRKTQFCRQDVASVR